MTKSWKTTLSGILSIALSVGHAAYSMINGQQVDFTTLIDAIMAGIGLLAAKDSAVTGGTISQPTVANPPTLIEKK